MQTGPKQPCPRCRLWMRYFALLHRTGDGENLEIPPLTTAKLYRDEPCYHNAHYARIESALKARINRP